MNTTLTLTETSPNGTQTTETRRCGASLAWQHEWLIKSRQAAGAAFEHAPAGGRLDYFDAKALAAV